MSQPTLTSITQTLTQSATTIETYEDQVIDLILQHKRRRMIESLSSRLDQQIEQRIATASMLHDHQLTSAAGEIVDIAKGIGRRMEEQRRRNAGSAAGNGTVSGFANGVRSYSTLSVRDARGAQSTRTGLIMEPTRRSISRSPLVSSSTSPRPSQSSFPRLSPFFTSRFQHTTTTQSPRTPSPNSKSPPRRPQAQPQPPTFQPPNTTPPNSTTSTTTRPALRPISELSPDELRKDPRYKAKARRWTGFMVGVPLSIMLTYVLYGRYRAMMRERERELRVMAGGGDVDALKILGAEGRGR